MDRRTQDITLLASAERTGAGAASPVDVSRFTEAALYIDVTALSGGGAIDLIVRSGPTDPACLYTHTTPAQITGTGKTMIKLTNLGPWMGLSYTITGTATFSAELVPKT